MYKQVLKANHLKHNEDVLYFVNCFYNHQVNFDRFVNFLHQEDVYQKLSNVRLQIYALQYIFIAYKTILKIYIFIKEHV